MPPPRFFYPDTPDLPLPPRHRFPAAKYRLLRDRVTAHNILGRARLVPSSPAAIADLCRAHDAGYVSSVLNGTISPETQRAIGLPWSTTLARRSRATVGGSLAAAREALSHGISGQLAGGTHHAHYAAGAGFCTFNDLAVTALALRHQNPGLRIAILDVDVHQGDGTAALMACEPAVFTVSVHGEKNYPFTKMRSDLDIGLADGTEDAAYLAAIDQALSAVAQFAPGLVLYLAGVDPLDADRLGRLSVSMDGLRQRDARVLGWCHTNAIPVAIVAGGGYAEPISETVAAYAATFEVAREIFGL